MSEIIKYNWRVREWFPNLDEDKHVLLKTYFDELVKFNKRINLVSPKSLDNADSVHFSDSALAAEIVYKKLNKNKYIADIGSGNGFPGLVFSVLFPDIQVELIDLDQRKIEFLKHLISRLSLKNVTAKVQDAGKLPAGVLDNVMTRGFATIDKSINMFGSALKPDGRIFFMKSADFKSEIDGMSVTQRDNWKVAVSGAYFQPVQRIEMCVLEASRI